MDGWWSDWSNWAECSVTCGVGQKKRTRACDSPPPAYGGGHCVGDDEKVVQCGGAPCPGEKSFIYRENVKRSVCQ